MEMTPISESIRQLPSLKGVLYLITSVQRYQERGRVLKSHFTVKIPGRHPICLGVSVNMLRLKPGSCTCH